MSSSSTSKLGLFKATAGTGEPFRTSDVNSNWDKVDAEAVSVDGRLDVVEANNWVTTARIADGAVGAAELASSLNLTGKTVSVATPSSGAHAVTKTYVDDRVPSITAWTSYTPTLSSGANAEATGFYMQMGKTVFVRVIVTFAGQPSSAVTVSMPVVGRGAVTSFLFSGLAKSTYPLFGTLSTGGGPTVTTVALKVMNTASTYGSLTAVTSSVPSVWAADDFLSFTAIYEAV